MKTKTRKKTKKVKLPKTLIELMKRFDKTFGDTSGVQPYMPELDEK